MKKAWLILVLLCLTVMVSGCGCKHAETFVVNAVDASCTAAGHTGDVQCSKCNEIVQKGEVIAAKGHLASELTEVKEATCAAEGYTGNQYCMTCGEQVHTGETIAKLPHTASDPIGVSEASCNSDGYTGDTVCLVCYEVLTTGTAIPMTEHTCAAERTAATAPSCEGNGYTGDVLCTVCTAVVQKGEVIPAIGHSWSTPENIVEATCQTEGYTGDQRCSLCSQIRQGNKVEKGAHAFEQHVCITCGWMEPGLYIEENELVFTWQQLLDYEIVKIEDDLWGMKKLFYVDAKNIKGKLVLSEEAGVTYHLTKSFQDCYDLREVYIPSTVTVLPEYCFSESGLEKVHFFGQIAEIPRSAFAGCTNLKEITIPEGVEVIGYQSFFGCVNLEKVTLPDSLREINGSFTNCPALKTIELPEGLTKITSYSFHETGIEQLTLPASLLTTHEDPQGSYQSNGAFSHCAALHTIDMSKSQVEYISKYEFTDSEQLTTLILPEGLKGMYASAIDGTAITELKLPRGFTVLNKFEWSVQQLPSTLKVIYWPVSFRDSQRVLEKFPLDTIYYEGTEAQWSTIASEGRYANVNVVCNYTYE